MAVKSSELIISIRDSAIDEPIQVMEQRMYYYNMCRISLPCRLYQAITSQEVC